MVVYLHLLFICLFCSKPALHKCRFAELYLQGAAGCPSIQCRVTLTMQVYGHCPVFLRPGAGQLLPTGDRPFFASVLVGMSDHGCFLSHRLVSFLAVLYLSFCLSVFASTQLFESFLPSGSRCVAQTLDEG
ncbi:hypothetical protein V8F06_008905 [Rhypophila decipiens]